ncbi:MAG: hypothetical protein KDC90_19720, partial [Ignavibacteriae bacterium]|nr:hypothetical protein [Ignavibacteriota bacterium]
TVNVPKGRVYELKTNGYYPLLNSPVTSENRHTVIIGSDPTPLVNDKNSSPPLICSVVAEMEGLPAFGIRGDFTIKNCKLVPANAAGALGWSFFYTKKSDLNLLFENCLFEHTRWVFVYNDAEHCNVTFKDSYFVNMSGYSQDDYMGGVIHSGESLESLVVENCTFIMAQGDLFNLGSNSANRTILNHNTFINCAGHILLSTCLRYICYKNLGLINNVSLTNNMFINCNLQPLDSCMIPDSDGKDYPAGIVNTNQTYIDSINTTQIKYLAQNNLAYWHPIIANCDSILNANTVNGSNCWQPQTFIMTSVTQELFNEDGDYPYLVTDTWKNKMPAFTKTQDLFTTQLENITKFVVEFADTSEQAFLPHWRVINNASNQFIYPDWPIPIDLSYSDADLLKGGIGGFPLGDLNWFPTKKAEWLKQRDSEYNNISEALNKGELVTAVQNQEIFPSQFYL